jgi:catecholate siderophore receptor
MKMKKSARFAAVSYVIAGVLLGAGVSAVAAENDVAQGEPRTLRKVQVKAGAVAEGYVAPTASSGTKTEAPLRDVPQTINVVPTEVIRDQHATSLQDIMKNVPGVGQSHGDGQRDQVAIRGFSAISDQFVDGFRDDALYFWDLSNIERVEIIKGPAAVLYGRGSSGGLINRVTKKPNIDLNEFSLSFGSNAGKRGEADVARVGEWASWRLTAAIEDADSYRDQQFLERKAFSPSIKFKLSDADYLLVQVDYLNDKRVTDFGVPAYQGKPVNVPASAYYGAANAAEADYSQAEVKSVTIDYTHRFSSTLSLRNGMRYYDYDLDRNNTLPSGPVNEVARTVQLNRTHLDREESGWFNQTELMQNLELAGMAHEVLYGIEFGKQDKDQLVRQRNNVAIVSLFNPVLPVLPLDISTAPTTDSTGIMKTSAAYVQDMLVLSSDWKALLGVRYDSYQQKTQQRLIGQPNLDRTDKVWSPRVGLVWQPGVTQSYYASWSQSFQPSGESFAITAANADISPEKSVNQEVGAKFDFRDGKLSVTAALFRLQRDNIKSTDPATNLLIPIGVQRTDGLELTTSGEMGSGWRWLAGYAWLDAAIIKSIARDGGQPVLGKRATITPRNSANFWLTKVVTPNFDVGGGGNYVGSRFANPGNTVMLPMYVTVDAMASYRIGGAELQLNLRNLLDRGYIVAGHGSNANLNLPGAPRNAALTVHYKF